MILAHSIWSGFNNVKKIIDEKRITSSEHKKSINREVFALSSYVSKEYPYTYYDGGLIFETYSNPVLVCPCDEWWLRQGPYLDGYEQFLFDSIKKMLKKFPSHEETRKAIKEWRLRYEKEIVTIPRESERMYTEVGFAEPIEIEPLALFGFEKKYKNLPFYARAVDYFL